MASRSGYFPLLTWDTGETQCTDAYTRQPSAVIWQRYGPSSGWVDTVNHRRMGIKQALTRYMLPLARPSEPTREGTYLVHRGAGPVQQIGPTIHRTPERESFFATRKLHHSISTTSYVTPRHPTTPIPPSPTKMADKNPPANAGDVEDEVQQAKSAEDRKAAAAMSRLDAMDDDSGSANVDSEAASKAMKSLGAAGAAKVEAAKKVKIDAADVALLVRLSPRCS
jgi:hypothetical protein